MVLSSGKLKTTSLVKSPVDAKLNVVSTLYPLGA